MKKTLLSVLSILVLFATVNSVSAKQVSGELARAIKLYKAKNYTQSYSILKNYVEEDPGNALAHYYLAISSTQLGKKSEALENYRKTLMLVPEHSKLGRYANKGKVCIEAPDMCREISTGLSNDDNFIYKNTGTFSDKVKSEYEKLKLENFMREMNRSNDIDTNKFREYKDFSSMNPNAVPSNDEVVAALRTLQKAGFGNMMNNHYADISLLTGNQYPQGQLFNMMGNSNLSPEVIQTMLTNNMSLGF